MDRRAGAVVTWGSLVLIAGLVAVALVSFNRPATVLPDIPQPQRPSAPFAPMMSETVEWGDLTIYPVLEDGTLQPLPEGLTGELWLTFLRLATPGFVADNVTEFRLAVAPATRGLTAVEPTTAAPLRWSLTVNVGPTVAQRDYLRALIHEYAHLLTLGAGQIDLRRGPCETTHLREGCLAVDASLQRFGERFWTRYGANAPGPNSDSRSAGWEHYLAHSADFLTSYAAMNVAEDFAETFTEFVIRDRPSIRSGPWAEKLLFMWEEPGYPEARERIRTWYSPVLDVPATIEGG